MKLLWKRLEIERGIVSDAELRIPDLLPVPRVTNQDLAIAQFDDARIGIFLARRDIARITVDRFQRAPCLALVVRNRVSQPMSSLSQWIQDEDHLARGGAMQGCLGVGVRKRRRGRLAP